MKFEVGDTVVGNAQNCHGITGEGCVVVVTRAGATSFDGIVQDHPDDSDYEGSTQTGLCYEWFDLDKDDDEDEYPDKTYKPGASVQITTSRHTNHYQSLTANYRGLTCKVVDYDHYDDWECEWILTVLFDNGHVAEVYESELVAAPYQAPKSYAPPQPAYKPVTVRAEEAPKDVKSWGRVREEIVVTPAHKADVKQPVKQPVKPSPLLTKLKMDGNEFTSSRRKRHNRVDVQEEYDLNA